MRYLLTDERWAIFEPLVYQAKKHKGGPPPLVSDRLFFEAVFYWARTGIPWRDLPAEFGAWDAIYNRLSRWVHSGNLRRLFEALTVPEMDEVRRVLVDSTILRAHAHAAGARRKKKLGPARSAAKQGLGRSRGGFSTKVMVVAVDEDTAVVTEVLPGQAADAPQLAKLVDATRRRLPQVDEVVGDKGFDGDEQRMACLDRVIVPTIPNKRNRVDPWPFCAETYRNRNRVERLIGKAKQFRRFATRYEKLKSMFLGVVHLVFGFIRLRRLAIVNTT